MYKSIASTYSILIRKSSKYSVKHFPIQAINLYEFFSIYKKTHISSFQYLWLPGITTYLHFSLFRVNRVFSFSISRRRYKLRQIQIKCNTASMDSYFLPQLLYQIAFMSQKSTFTYVVIPGINTNFSGVKWVFQSQWQLRGFSGN